MKVFIISSGFLLSSLSGMALAESKQCEINFTRDLSVNNQQVTVSENGKEVWRVNNSGQLWLEGSVVKTDRNTQGLLKDYQAGIYQQANEVVALVEEALVLAGDAVVSVMTELTGQPAAQNPSIQKVLDNMSKTRDTIITRNGDSIEVHGSRIDSISDQLGDELSRVVEEVVTQSVGSLLLQAGKAISGGEGSFVERMEAFGKRMESMGEQLETRIEQQAQGLEQRGEVLCKEWHALDALETRIQQAVPQLKPFDLINSGKGNNTTYRFN